MDVSNEALVLQEAEEDPACRFTDNGIAGHVRFFTAMFAACLLLVAHLEPELLASFHSLFVS